MRRYLLALSLLPLLALGCPGGGNSLIPPDDDEKNKGLIQKLDKKIDDYTPTEAARNRRAGLEMGKTIHFVIDLNGKRVGSGTRLTKESSYRGRDAIVVNNTREMSEFYQGVRLEKNDSWKLITDADSGKALYSSKHSTQGGNDFTESVAISGNKAIFETSGGGSVKEEVIQVPNDILFSVDPRWLLKQGLSVGKTLTATILDRGARAVTRESVVIRDHREEKVNGVALMVWEAEIRRESGNSTRIVFTELGEMIRQTAITKQGTIDIRVVNKFEGARDGARLAFNTTVPIDFDLPAWDNFSVLTYEAFPAEKWKKHLKDSGYMQMRPNGDRIELQLKKNVPRIVPATLPMKIPAAIKSDYLLQTSDRINPEPRAIRKMAQKIAGEERRVAMVAARLAGWIYQNVEYRPVAMQSSSPERVLEARQGTALEKANLFASMARALGIPTRHCEGLLIQDKMAIQHNWVEIWIDNAWLPVDPSVNRVGVPAGYLLLSWGKGDGNPDTSFQWIIREGGIGLHFVSATKIVRIRNHPASFTLMPKNPNTYVAMSKDQSWLANLRWGFSFSKPISWHAEVTPTRTTITDPNKQVRMVFEALDLQMDVDRNQLANRVSDLKHSLNGFELVTSGIVPFGRRESPSLFIDFYSTQNGLRQRCQMYIIPKRDRTYRVSSWAPADEFSKRLIRFKDILATVDL